MELPGNISAACEFELGPLCSNDDNAIEVICSFWSSDRGEGGWYPDEQALVPPPRRAQIDRLDELFKASGDAYGDLSDDEKDRAFDAGRPSTTPGLARYDAARAQLDEYYAELRRPERARIELALARLSELLVAARSLRT